jgi:hypothetical protein
MDYDAMLKVVKGTNPGLSFKQQQKKASEMLKEFKEAQGSFLAGSAKKVIPDVSNTGTDEPQEMALSAGQISMSELIATEKKIRANVIDAASIITHGREIMPDGQLKKYGMSGVNTLVTFEDEKGNCLPVVGYFVVWM